MATPPAIFLEAFVAGEEPLQPEVECVRQIAPDAASEWDAAGIYLSAAAKTDKQLNFLVDRNPDCVGGIHRPDDTRGIGLRS